MVSPHASPLDPPILQFSILVCPARGLMLFVVAVVGFVRSVPCRLSSALFPGCRCFDFSDRLFSLVLPLGSSPLRMVLSGFLDHTVFKAFLIGFPPRFPLLPRPSFRRIC